MSASLPEPTTDAGRAGLAALLGEPAQALLAVDYDGTLAPIVERPEDARPAAGATAALAALAGRIGHLAVVSGRAASDVVALGDLEDVDGLRVLGHYGLQEWRAGRLSSPEPLPAIADARQRLAAIVSAAADGVHLEDKTHSIVVHTRPADDPAAALADLEPAVCAVADELGLEALPGRMVLEVRPRGMDKGAALRRLVEETKPAAVGYVGDDLGDLPAFAAIADLRKSGVPGFAVASVDPALDDSPRELAERADLVLPGPAAVVDFLRALAATH
ncbi:MAG: trehalose-phosphatase [Frankiales bacterium]|nr:trehalose-phosphatase [Frankiales bacterium]